MEAIYEYSLFLLVCTCMAREALWPSVLPVAWQVEMFNPLAEHRAWLEHIDQARQQNNLGPLRLEDRQGRLCVIGLGECRPVESVPQGIELITTLKSQIAELF